MSTAQLYTTFELLREHEACKRRYRYLARKLGGVLAYGRTTPIPLLKILEVNGLDDAEWALRAVPEEQQALRDRIARHIACDYAERVLPIFEEAVPGDSLPRDTIAVSRRFADGKASSEELAARKRYADTAVWYDYAGWHDYAALPDAAATAATAWPDTAAWYAAAATAATAWPDTAAWYAFDAAQHAAYAARHAGRRDERPKQRDIFTARLKEEWT